MVTTAMAQITTSSVSGKITANGEDVIGATIKAVHQPSGTVYRAVTNIDGRYSIQGMRPGGPYVLEVTYVGYKNKQVKGISLSLGQNTVLNETLAEDAAQLEDVVVVADRNNNMRTDRAGATTSINADQIEAVPTVSRSMNDLLKLTPQGANVGSGFSVGGGNYRQSYVTVDGAAFNNAFGIGGNLPGNGSPISLDALDQISVSSSPYDVRLSGFTGGAISAVTKSGTNDFKGTAYMYTTNSHLRGNKVSDYELNRLQSHSTTWGVSFGGPIIKDKLFFFANGEYQSNISAGPSGTARVNASDEWSPSSGTVHRPLQSDMDNMLSFLNKTYGYNPGRYQGYSLDTPSYKFLARIDWNINENNKLNIRFSKSHDKDSSNPSSSTTPFKDSVIYPGGEDATGGKGQSGRTSNAGLYFESARYYQEKNFTSVAAEWNSKWGGVSNVLRATYSYQDEPRTYVGGMFPTVDILKNGSYYMGFGPDPFTQGNLRQVKTFVATDEASWAMGIQNFTAGLQFETNEATNGFGAASAGYYVFESMDDFMNGKAPRSYGVTFPMDGSSQFNATMKYNQFSAYVQDQVNFSDRFRLTAGLRFELPIYPELENNYNKAFAAMKWKNDAGVESQYTTDQLPDAPLTVSPRVGFNWDILGNHKLVLRGGTGYFVGRLPFVWLVSAVGNAGCGQYTYYYNTPSDKGAKYLMDKFTSYNPKLFAANAEAVASLQAYLTKRGISMYTMPVPVAAQLLTNKLPAYAPVAGYEKMLALLQDAGLRTVDVKKVLDTHTDENIYYRTDHHWTSLGAYYAYCEWMNLRGRKTAPESCWTKKELCSNFRGTTWNKVPLPTIPAESITAWYRHENHSVSYNNGDYKTNSIYEKKYLKGSDQYAVFLNSNQAQTLISGSGDEGSGKLLLLKDSYGNTFSQFACEDFEEVHVIDLRFFRGDIRDYIQAKGITDVLLLYGIQNFASDVALPSLA